MRIIFLGRGELGLQILQRVLDEGHDVPLILATSHTPEVGSSPEAFQQVARDHGIEYDYVTRLTDQWNERFRSMDADLAIAIQWRTVIQDESIATTRHGFLNVHCGDLPRYRGNATPNWAILLNEPEAVLCAHLMVPGELDSGGILAKARMPLTTASTIGDIYSFIFQQGPEIVAQAIETLASPEPQIETQDEGNALRCYPRLPVDGEIDWSGSADDVCRLIQSLSDPFDGAFTFLRGQKLRIWSACPVDPPMAFVGVPGHVVDLRDDGSVRVITGDQGMVELREIQIGDQQRCRPRDLINSIRIRLGMNTSSQLVSLKRQLEQLREEVESLKQASHQPVSNDQIRSDS